MLIRKSPISQPISSTNSVIVLLFYIVTHLLYNPNTAPSDDHFFSEMKKHMGGTHFATEQKLKKEVLATFAARKFYNLDVKQIVHRTQKYIDLNDDYVEK